MIEGFCKHFQSIRIKATVADNGYGSARFIEQAAELTNQPQVISQIRKTQLINVNGRYVPIGQFFESHKEDNSLYLR